ncbi:MAG: PIN domain-containing protein [Deferrisomatales bacterium]|nr:PIN domain-containing protein [Deferrisomatales bacterium]
MDRVFVDTSAWYEFADQRAAAHEVVSALIDEHRGRMITSTFVLAELTALVVARFDHRLAVTVDDSIRGSSDVELLHPVAAEEEEAWDLFRARPDKSYSLTDCLSFVIMRRTGVDTALSADQHFKQEGFQTLPLTPASRM